MLELAGVQIEGNVPHGLVEAMDRVEALAAKGEDVFEWKLRRPPQDSRENEVGDASVSEESAMQLKTSAKPVLATGFYSGIGKMVNHLFEWTEQALCATSTDSASDTMSQKVQDQDQAQLFAVGDTVEIGGLQGAPQHNGTKGVVRRFDKEKARYVVEVAGMKKPLAVKAKSLTLIVSQHDTAAAVSGTSGAGGDTIPGASYSTWESSDTMDLLEQHVAKQTPGSGSKVANLTRMLQLAESAKANLEQELSEAICAGGEKAAVTTVAYNTVASNVEQLRVQLAEAEADAAQAPITQKVGHSVANLFACCFLCLKRVANTTISPQSGAGLVHPIMH